MFGHSNIFQTADTYMYADERATAAWMDRFEKALATLAPEERPRSTSGANARPPSTQQRGEQSEHPAAVRRASTVQDPVARAEAS